MHIARTNFIGYIPVYMYMYIGEYSQDLYTCSCIEITRITRAPWDVVATAASVMVTDVDGSLSGTCRTTVVAIPTQI